MREEPSEFPCGVSHLLFHVQTPIFTQPFTTLYQNFGVKNWRNIFQKKEGSK
jgi:hypothetical protein